MPSIKGTASVADDRAISKLLRSTRFPPNFSKKVDQTRVHREVLSQWIEDRIQELLGFEDDIVASTAVNLFLPPVPEDGARPAVDPRAVALPEAGQQPLPRPLAVGVVVAVDLGLRLVAPLLRLLFLYKLWVQRQLSGRMH